MTNPSEMISQPIITPEFVATMKMVSYVNLSLLVTMIGSLMGAVWWLSKLDSRVHDSKATGIRAHKRIDKLDDKMDDLLRRDF